MKTSKYFLVLSISIGFILLVIPMTMWADNLQTKQALSLQINNPGFETPFNKIGEYENNSQVWDLQVADGWNHFDLKQERLRFFSSCEWKEFNNGPVCEKVEGDEAQVIWTSSNVRFDAGVYQQISGLTIGESYGFQAATLMVFESTTNPVDNPDDPKMQRKVGIDPYGGTDPKSENVIWSPIDIKDVAWFWPSVGAKAMSSTMTVFVRVRGRKKPEVQFSNSQVWIDDASLDYAPTMESLTLDVGDFVNEQATITATWHGTIRDGFEFYASESQLCELSSGETTCDDPNWDGTWQDLHVFRGGDELPPTATTANFIATQGITYMVRARVWHRNTDGRPHNVASPWKFVSYFEDTPSPISQGKIMGTVFDTEGEGVNANVIISPTLTVMTTNDGKFDVETGAGTFNLMATTDTDWETMQPLTVMVPQSDTVIVTMTVTPPDNFIQNGGFENTMSDWQSTITAPTFITDGSMSGYSLAIPENAILTQTGYLTNAYQPNLSFWYKIINPDEQSRLVAQIFGRDTLTPTKPLILTESHGWKQAHLPLDLREFMTGTGSIGSVAISSTSFYTGMISVRFSIEKDGVKESHSAPQNYKFGTPNSQNTAYYLDDVSMGSILPEPTLQYIYLPLILKFSPTPELRFPESSANTFNLVSIEGSSLDKRTAQKRSNQILVAIRDTGQFMDTRSRKDWWE